MTPAARIVSIEKGPRHALGLGSALLFVGLGMTGIGALDTGAVVTLGGLLLTIFGIHTFGRLGTEGDDEGDEADLQAVKAAHKMADVRVWEGALLALTGIAASAGTLWFPKAPSGTGRYEMAVAFVAAGAIQALRGFRARGEVRRHQAKVEKRRHLDKSPRP